MERRKAYSSDLTDAQWKKVRPLIPKVLPGGPPRTVNMRKALNAIFYRLKTGNIQDRDGGKQVLEKARASLKRFRHVWADSAYSGALQEWAKAACGWEVVIVRRTPGCKTLEVLPKRWIVERFFAWLNPYRLLR